MILKVSGSFSQASLGVEKLRAVFEVLKTAYFVSEDETVRVYVWVKLLNTALLETAIDTYS